MYYSCCNHFLLSISGLREILDDVTDEFSFGLAITTTLKCFVMSYLPLFVVFVYCFVRCLSSNGNRKKLASSRFHLMFILEETVLT